METYLFSAAIAQSALVSLLLLTSAYRREAPIIFLSAIFLTFNVLFLIVILRDHGVESVWLNADLPLGYGLIALIVCLTLSAVGKMRRPTRTGFAAFLGLTLLGSLGLALPLVQPIWVFLLPLLLALSVIWSIYQVRQYVRAYDDQYSTADLSRLSWLETSLYLMAGVVCLGVVQSFAEHTPWTLLAQGSIASVPLLFIILNMYLSTQLLKAEPVKIARASSPRAAGTGDLSEAELVSARAKLEAIMDRDAVFRQPDLQLNELSRLSGLSEDTIRATIKSFSAKNFFDYINGLRIGHSRTLLRDTSLSVTDVMFESGFKSRSSFNTEFRKRTGHTPSEFRKLHL